MSEEQKIKKFTSLFQQLENLVNERGGSKPVFKDNLYLFAKNNTFVNNNLGMILDLYALRNVYSHMQRGRYIASLEDYALSSLDSMLEKIKNPPTAQEIFSPSAGEDKVFQADQYDRINLVMEMMTNNEFTHVPVWSGKVFVGVFAYNSFFQWVNHEIQRGNTPIFQKEIMQDINPRYLNAPAVRYEFISSTHPAYEVASIFQYRTERRRRLDCIFITKTGKKGEEILGIITPWDLYKVQ